MPGIRIMSALVMTGALLLMPVASAQQGTAANAIQALEVSSKADKVVVKMSLARLELLSISLIPRTRWAEVSRTLTRVA